MDINGIGCKNVEQDRPALDRFQWRASVDMDNFGSIKGVKFLDQLRDF
jgi:hypothetical protein